MFGEEQKWKGEKIKETEQKRRARKQIEERRMERRIGGREKRRTGNDKR